MRGRKTSQGNIGHTERRKEKGLDPTSPSEQQQLKIGRYENDIERHRKGYAERVVRSGDGSIGHRPLRRRLGGGHRRGNPIWRVELHVRHPHRPAFSSGSYRNFHLVINPLIHTDMAKVDNIFEYMAETYINGNFSTFRKLYHELNKEARKDFIDFLLSEVEPTYWRDILKETI